MASKDQKMDRVIVVVITLPASIAIQSLPLLQA